MPHTGTVSVNVDTRVVEPGNQHYLEEAWALKERVREADNVLKQRRNFFASAYRKARVRLTFVDEDLAGFVATREDGYILFLAVHPEHRGHGFGRTLVGDVVEEHGSVTCHARTTNDRAVGFYEHLGFSVRRRIDRYYEDGGDAYFLELREDESLRSKLSELVRR
jgi:ribosomal protein S18 acetylase RimI-like enzyme